MATSSSIFSNGATTPHRQLFVGSLVSPKNKRELTLIANGLLGVDDSGKIAFLEDLDRTVTQTVEDDDGDDDDDDGNEGSLTPSASDATLSTLSRQQRAALLSHLATHQWSLGECQVTLLKYGDFICPGFIDTHTHACQVPNVGVGQQYELLDWLENVTFPKEKQFADVVYAEKTYNSVVQRLLDSGTTTACYYASLHLDATKILAKICSQRGQRAMVGKCQMDRNAPANYVEKSVAESIQDTKSLIKYCGVLHKQALKKERKRAQGVSSPSTSGSSSSSSASSSPTSESTPDSELSDDDSEGEIDEDEALMRDSVRRLSATVDEMMNDSDDPKERTGNAAALPTERPSLPTKKVKVRVPSLYSAKALVQPIITPRFAISCTDALLTSISALVSRDPSLRIQTHLSESPGEIAFTAELFPFAKSYTHVYDFFNLLGNRTVLAHCIHLSSEEMDLIKSRDSGVSHCPVSNMNIRSGASPVGEMLNRGIKVGLGTDVSGGYGVGMLSAIREASVVAKVLSFTKREYGLLPSSSSPSSSSSSSSAQGDATHVRATTIATPNAIATEGQHDFTSSPLEVSTLLWLATMGGAEVASVADQVGSLEVGKDFDALLVSMYHQTGEEEEEQEETEAEAEAEAEAEVEAYSGNPSVYVEEGETLLSLLEKFLFTADDRNLRRVYVKGRLVGGVDRRRGKKGRRGRG